jgi:hypothetical protein
MDTLHIFYSFQIHGTADDNVHYQQSMVFAKALSQKGALFKQQIYPDEGHSLSGVRRHLYRTMTLFFEDCFKKLVNIDEKKKLKKTINYIGYVLLLLLTLYYAMHTTKSDK